MDYVHIRIYLTTSQLLGFSAIPILLDSTLHFHKFTWVLGAYDLGKTYT